MDTVWWHTLSSLHNNIKNILWWKTCFLYRFVSAMYWSGCSARLFQGTVECISSSHRNHPSISTVFILISSFLCLHFKPVFFTYSYFCNNKLLFPHWTSKYIQRPKPWMASLVCANFTWFNMHNMYMLMYNMLHILNYHIATHLKLTSPHFNTLLLLLT